MTTKHHKGLFRPRRYQTIVTYGTDSHVGLNLASALDGTKTEYALERGQRHREAQADDPYLSPAKSEAVRALLVLIEFAQAHTYSTAHTPDNELDLRGFCEDARLTPKQVEAVLMVGEGWGIAAIAERLEITRRAVELRLHYGRRKLIRQTLPVDKHSENTYSRLGQLSLGAG